MADPTEHFKTSETDQNSYLSHLREAAQAHLEEIQNDITIEAEQMSKGEEELKRYSKPSKKARKETPASLTSPAEEKGPRLRSAQDVLHRLRWDPKIKIDEYHVGYLERFEGLKEMPASSWIREFTDEEWIPQHRIKYVKRVISQDEHDVVWDREARIDKIFGSGPAVIDESIDGSVAGGATV